jgi:hypothetical protein
MGQIYSSYKHYTFKELQTKIETNRNDFVLLNTLDLNRQNYLIHGTIHGSHENDIVNQLLKKDKNKEIIIYGQNHHDLKVIDKYNKLKKLGFANVYIYFGGLFEWALLQEIYGESNFQTDGKIKDLLTII